MDADKTLDLAKAAQLHYEISTLCSENELSGITVVDEELLWVNECGQKLRDEGIRVLERGLEGLNQAEVGAGLQVVNLILLLQYIEFVTLFSRFYYYAFCLEQVIINV